MTKNQTSSTSNPYRLRVATGITGVIVALSIYDSIAQPPLEQSLLGAMVALAIAWGGLGADYIRQLTK
jgi:hypothetical protein